MRKRRGLWLLALFMTAVGCEERDSPGRDSCAQVSFGWGLARVILGLIPMDDAAAALTLEVRSQAADGAPAPVRKEGCPKPLPAPFLCSFVTNGGTVEATEAFITVQQAGEVTPDASAQLAACEQLRVPLAPYNTCARDIAYVTAKVRVSSDRLTCEYSEVRYINPLELHDWKSN